MASPFARLLVYLDPRRGMAAATGWLVIWLALALGGCAGFMAGEMTRHALLEQRRERAANAAEQWSAGLENLLSQRLQPIRTAAAMVPEAVQARDMHGLAVMFADLHAIYPEFAWIALADANGQLLASVPASGAPDVADQSWFRAGLKDRWMNADERVGAGSGLPWVIDLARPVRDEAGHTIGVVGARLDMDGLQSAAAALREHIPVLDQYANALVIDARGRVMVGPPSLIGQPAPAARKDVVLTEARPGERLQALGWRVQLSWPLADVTQRADADRRQIVLVSLGVGVLAAVIGVGLARRLTRRLQALAHAVEAIDPHASEALPVPPGQDEASRLGTAFNTLLGALQRERNALGDLTAELETRVRTRTRQVEALAEEARYAAVVRERLRIARDLHDTLAHSMMAMLTEVRILKKLHTRDPAALGAELERAEAAAHEGLAQARAAITQMRFNAVRDGGLGPALGAALDAFAERSGLQVHYGSDPRAAAFADQRAESVFRIAEEALRNVERHAQATRVEVSLKDVEGTSITLRIGDDGVGFDPAAPVPGHYGIVGLREQAQLIGARLSIDSAAGRGTVLQLWLRTEPDLDA